MSFYKNRMKLLKVTDKNNVIEAINPMADTGSKVVKFKIFEEDAKGNILINFTTIDREMIFYEKKGDGKMSQINAKWLPFQQKRLQFPKGDMKYIIPSSPYPFFAPLLQDCYKKKTKIKRLFITEGAFKGWLACLYGVHTVGLTSITHFRDPDTKKLHRDIVKLILECKVEEVVILWDADCLNISIKDLSQGRDLVNRPKRFFNCVKLIKDLLGEVDEIRRNEETLNQLDIKDSSDEEAGYKSLKIHFWHIKEKTPKLKDPKGLDDLLIVAKEKKMEQTIVKELQKDDGSSPFFFKSNITNEINTLKNYFCLEDAERFYLRHGTVIGLEQFHFRRDIYEWNDKELELRLVAPSWANKLIWVGSDFFMKQNVPNAYGEIEERLVKHPPGDLQRRTGKKDFHTYLTDHCYNGFVNIPDHYNYRQTFEVNDEKYYNKYFPFKHRPKEGNFETTLDFIKHIFGHEEKVYHGKKYKSWELGLDYIQLLLEKPTQTLPVLILFSEENATGKSTFGNWLRFIFGSNSIKVSNRDFKADFNAHFSSKLIVVCEETLLDRRKDSESIKDMSTSKHITVNEKGVQQHQIDFFAKFIFMSNNKRMIYLTKHDQRYWILKVPKIKKDDPHITDKLEAEFPAFLQYMQNRKMVSSNDSRMWFHHSLIKTRQFYQTVQVNEPAETRELREKVRQYFLDFNVKELKMPLKDINEYFFRGNKADSWIKENLKDYNLAIQSLNEKGYTKTERGEYFRWEKNIDPKTDELETVQRTVKWIARGPWIFDRDTFVLEGEDEPAAAPDDQVNPADLMDQTNEEDNEEDPKGYPAAWDQVNPESVTN